MHITLVQGDITAQQADAAARIALETVRQAGTSVEDVRFVLFDSAAYAVFEARLVG
ncbi:hypothetical protein ABGB18_42130 [Nonomuraea sp. B12E4]|uniref:hypothetical protein n=1 Tax=Nonomuraea sp. B12E4 TaxID=3153564 RepID=UPI00325C7F06